VISPIALACPGCGEILPSAHRRETWVEVERSPGWTCAYRIVSQLGRPVVAEVRVFPAEAGHRQAGRWSADDGSVPVGGVAGRMLRTLRLGDPRETFPRIIKDWKALDGDAATTLSRARHTAAAQAVPRRPGRTGRPDSFYLAWAVAYVERLRAGSRRPAAELAMDPPVRIEGYVSGEDGAWVRTVKDILRTARRRGLLGPAPMGMAGGELTPKAHAMLERSDAPGPSARRR
jgi:hypothetical protein